MKKQTLSALTENVQCLAKKHIRKIKGGIGGDDVELGITNTDIGGM